MGWRVQEVWFGPKLALLGRGHDLAPWGTGVWLGGEEGRGRKRDMVCSQTGPDLDAGKGHGPAVTSHVGLGIWEFGEGRVAVSMATAPLVPNFPPCGEPHGPDTVAPQTTLNL